MYGKLQRQIGERQADGIEADRFDTPVTLQEQKLDAVEEDRAVDEFDRQNKRRTGEGGKADAAAVLARDRNLERRDEHWQLADRIAGKCTADAKENRPQEDRNQLQRRTYQGNAQERADALLADQIVLAIGAERLKNEKYACYGDDFRSITRPMQTLRIPIVGDIAGEQDHGCENRRLQEVGGKAQPLFRRIAVSLQLR